MGFRTVCIEGQSRLSYSSGYLLVRTNETDIKVHLDEISSLVLGNPRSYISAYLLSELAKKKIPVVFCDEKMQPIAESLPLCGAHNCLEKVSEQLSWTEPSKKRVWQHVVRQKIAQQAALLEREGHHHAYEVLQTYRSDVKSGDTTNREAAAASLYFTELFGTGFTRDLAIPLNAALNYGYAILMSRVAREIVSRGYLTQCGINHRGELNQWNLACDLMEPFRPYVDMVVIDSMGNSFEKDDRHVLMNMMNRTLEYKGGQYKVSSVISLYVYDCLSALGKTIDAADISGYQLT